MFFALFLLFGFDEKRLQFIKGFKYEYNCSNLARLVVGLLFARNGFDLEQLLLPQRMGEET